MCVGQLVRSLGGWADVLSAVVRFARHGTHPRRREIVADYLRFQSRMRFSKRPPSVATVLGTEIRFSDSPEDFGYLLTEIFISEVYRCCDPPPATILDCGANVGMSVLLFKSLWPDAVVTAVEACPETCALLQQNTKQLPGVTVLNRAVSDRRGPVTMFSGYNSLLNSTHAARGGASDIVVESVPLSELIQGPVDLLKMDIEGSEIPAMDELEASGKMGLIRDMLIEYHHHLPGETHRLSVFLDRLERCGFSYELGATPPAQPGEFQDVLICANRAP